MSNIAHKLRTMLEIQDDLNKIIHPEWRDQGYRFEDAITVEAVELFDHLPWKWWKKYTGAIDVEQAKLEAVDIWHFVMSRLLEDSTPPRIVYFLQEDLEEFQATDLRAPIDPEGLKGAVRDFIHDVSTENLHDEASFPNVSKGEWYVCTFLNVLNELRMSFDELYTLYVAKTQLNRLRWANGYGTTYIKTWHGQEDNVWLMAYVKTLDVNAPDFKDQVYAGLVAQYELVKKAALADPDVEALQKEAA